MSEMPLYEGPIGNTGMTLRILPIEDHMHRGILNVLDVDGNLAYQKEVPVDRMIPNGGTAKHFAEWQKAVLNWSNSN